SGNNKAASVLFVIARLPNSRDGTATTWSGKVMVAKIRRIIASFSIQNVMNGFIARVYPSRNRVPQGPLERLERHAGKLAGAVLRGLGGSNASRLLGEGAMATWFPLPDLGRSVFATGRCWLTLSAERSSRSFLI